MVDNRVEEKRQAAKELLCQMTLEEKTSLLSGEDFWHLKAVERLGLKSIMIADGPHGLRKQKEDFDHLGLGDSISSTCFPTASASACSFDRELLIRMGKAIAEECVEEDIAMILGPGINIKRSPLCGRNFEYFSEDPYLSGEMAIAFINGVQSKQVGTSLKHYAVNNQEAFRMTVDAQVDERALREIYLSAFEAVVKKAKPWSVMASYNKINGTYACSNHYLLTDILRSEWGFEGMVISDWGAVNDRVDNVRAGMDLEMPGTGTSNNQEVVTALKNESLSMEELDLCVQRVVEFILKGQEESVKLGYQFIDHHDLAREIATKSAVLLQNKDDILPISSLAKVAVIGGMAKYPRYQGAGSSRIHPSKLDNALDALQIYGVEVSYADGYTMDSKLVDDEKIQDACEVARECDVALVFAGLPEEYESEGFDRSSLSMPESHNQLILSVAAIQANTVVILQLGSPVVMPWKDQVKGILLMYLAGQAGGTATAELLLGKVNPSGKLAETFPNALEDTPSYHYFPGENKVVQYRESIFVGYRYYDTVKKKVSFPFGYGLSYTKFEYHHLVVHETENYDYQVELDITNVGGVDGAEIVQLYVRCGTTNIFRAEKELKGFQKIFLKAGETGKVEFFLEKRSFAYYNTQAKDWCVEGGEYELLIGSSCADIRLHDKIELIGDGKEILLSKAYQMMTEYKEPSVPLIVSDEQFKALLGYEAEVDLTQKVYSKDSSLNDIKVTFFGKMLYILIQFVLKRKLKAIDHPTTKLMVEKTTFDMPLRSLKMAGGISNSIIDGLVQFVNGNILDGIKTLCKGKEDTMMKRHKGQIGQIEKDLRFQLFNGYLLFIVLFAGIYLFIHFINRRPLINIVTTFIIFAATFLLYWFSKYWGEYTKVRIFLMAAIVFFFIPFGYYTSPGSESAVIYTILLVINMISFVAVKQWEYLFALFACFETLILLQTERWLPDHYMKYNSIDERISDISFFFAVVSVATIITIYFVMKSYSRHSESFYVESITDSLTGLYNRRYINEFIQNEYNRAHRHEEHFSVALLDLNNFKKINDQRGHHEGDKVLAEISTIIKENIRNYDVPARYGGDEFIIIFPDTRKEKATELFFRLETAFEKYGRKYHDQGFAVSYGIEDSVGKSLEDIYKITDQLMYQKKNDQKNRERGGIWTKKEL